MKCLFGFIRLLWFDFTVDKCSNEIMLMGRRVTLQTPHINNIVMF